MHNITDRRHTAEGVKMSEAILSQLHSGETFNKADFPIHDARIDFRGVSLPPNLRVKDFHFEDIDFSDAHLIELSFESCKFINVRFTKCQLNGSRFVACAFDDVVFEESSLESVFMNDASGVDHGVFKNTSFIQCNLRGTEYKNTLFDNCRFFDCDLNQVDFNGSRFTDCKFRGKLKEVFFRGRENGTKKKISSLRNEMKNVDFSDAHLESVEFVDNIDLTTCVFPSSDDYIVIKGNRNAVFEEARKEISTSWTGMPKNLGLNLIDKGFLSPRQRNNKGAVIDRHFLTTNGDFGNNFFELIRQINDRMNASV